MKHPLHDAFKQTCEANNTSISKTLKTLVVLFLHDSELQQRVLREVTRF
jgi:hypothetical protein